MIKDACKVNSAKPRWLLEEAILVALNSPLQASLNACRENRTGCIDGIG